MSLTGFAAMVWIGAISTCIAYWLWGRLLRDYPAALVVPFALLVPFVGSAASSIVFGEHFGPLRLAGMVTVIGGIAVMLLARRPKPYRSPSLQKSPDRTMSQSLLYAFLVFVAVMFVHAGTEQRHAAVVGADLRFPSHPAAYRGHHHRRLLHDRRGRRRPRRGLHQLSSAEGDPEICRRGLFDLSRDRDRDVGRHPARTTGAAR